jgi:hypothetical protein
LSSYGKSKRKKRVNLYSYEWNNLQRSKGQIVS